MKEGGSAGRDEGKELRAKRNEPEICTKSIHLSFSLTTLVRPSSLARVHLDPESLDVVSPLSKLHEFSLLSRHGDILVVKVLRLTCRSHRAVDALAFLLSTQPYSI